MPYSENAGSLVSVSSLFGSLDLSFIRCSRQASIYQPREPTARRRRERERATRFGGKGKHWMKWNDWKIIFDGREFQLFKRLWTITHLFYDFTRVEFNNVCCCSLCTRLPSFFFSVTFSTNDCVQLLLYFIGKVLGLRLKETSEHVFAFSFLFSTLLLSSLHLHHTYSHVWNSNASIIIIKKI